MTPYGLTKVQAKTLAFIAAFIKQNDYSPSYQEIADGVGLRSKRGVHRIVHSLFERGVIARLPNRARTIRVLWSPDDA